MGTSARQQMSPGRSGDEGTVFEFFRVFLRSVPETVSLPQRNAASSCKTKKASPVLFLGDHLLLPTGYFCSVPPSYIQHVTVESAWQLLGVGPASPPLDTVQDRQQKNASQPLSCCGSCPDACRPR